MQTRAEMLMPRAAFEALERRRDELWAQGLDPYDPVNLANGLANDEEDEDESEDDEPSETTPEEALRMKTIATFRSLLSIDQGAAYALYDDQAIRDLDSLRDLDDKMIDAVCLAIIKPGRDMTGHPFPILSQARLKLTAFWARHLRRTSRELDDWLEVEWAQVKALAPQKDLEDNYKDSKAPPTPELTLDQATAAANFAHMRNYLRKCRSLTSGLPLDHVIRVKLRGPYDEPNTEEADPPPFGDPLSPYVSFDDEMVARAPILHANLTVAQLGQDNETLEMKGPFEPSFVTDSAIVYDILHTVWGKSSWWTHCKSFDKTKNGRQAFRTLHAQLLGGEKVVSSGSAIMQKIQSLKYEGDKTRFTFDRYVQCHVEQHNLHRDLEEHGVDPLSEELKILWFEQGIKTTAMDPVKASILTQKSSYTTFQAIQDAYVDYYRKVALTDPAKTRQIATVRAGRRTGTQQRSSNGQGQGNNARSRGVFTKEELDGCHIVNKDYSKKEYKKLTSLQKMKLWILRNPGKTPGEGPTRKDNRDRSSVASTSTASTGKRTREADDDMDAEEDGEAQGNNPSWGRNRDNPAVAGRQRPKPET
jgi:hypothetical protein